MSTTTVVLRSLLLLSCASLSAACEPLFSSGTPESPAYAPRPRLPPALTCEQGIGPALAPPPPAAPAEQPSAGQMSEASANAKRLFDAEKWNEAVPELQRVWVGQTGDDQGNRDLAQYHFAIALFRLHREDDAIDAFRAIASRPNHLKHSETLLWLEKIVESRPELVRLSDFSAYTAEHVAKFDNANQRQLFHSLSYLLARERLAEGKRDEARVLFTHVGDEHPWAPLVQQCLAAMK